MIMKTKYFIFYSLALAVLVSSCGTKKRLQEAEARYSSLDRSYRVSQNELSRYKDSTATYKRENDLLLARLQEEKKTSSEMIDRLKDLSVISSSQAESINKSVESISSKDVYIRDLQSAISRKDSLILALVMNLKGAIGNLDD